MVELSLIQKVTVWALPVLFAITLHEVAHGWVASLCGDQTARLSGRLSWNPLKHVDLVGTIIIPLMFLLLSSFIFGWAKPVPVDGRNLRHPRRDMALVAAAGPLANLVMALIWAAIARIGLSLLNSNTWLGVPILYAGEAGIMINVVLAVINLVPIPPLDGGRALASLLPPRWSWQLSRIEPYGFLIMVLLLMSGLLFYLISPLIMMLLNLIVNVFGLP